MRQTTTLQWFAGLSQPAQQRLLREAADLQYDEPTAPDAHGASSRLANLGIGPGADTGLCSGIRRRKKCGLPGGRMVAITDHLQAQGETKRAEAQSSNAFRTWQRSPYSLRNCSTSPIRRIGTS